MAVIDFHLAAGDERVVGIDAERIMLGSDNPFPLGEERPGEMIASMTDLQAETRERLLSGTARAFLGL